MLLPISFFIPQLIIFQVKVFLFLQFLQVYLQLIIPNHPHLRFNQFIMLLFDLISIKVIQFYFQLDFIIKVLII